MSVDSRYALASRLAQFLRRNGDKVINGSCKLSLTTSALCLLNSLFTEILNPDFLNQIDLSDSGVYRVHEDVQYLYDFMKKTSSLKLFHGMQTLRGGVDLSHFSNLTMVELRKIPAHLIIGLSSLSIQLKALICSRSIYLLKELFGSFADEQNTSDVWTELKELNLSYNYLESLDDSIKSLPNVEFIDLSHNNLRSTHEIQILKRLSFVNLNYNILESLPVFSSSTCRYLNKLYVRNNNLERLEGLECLFNLEEFDVGYNLLSEYWVLGPLDKLKSLRMLNLEGNPLYFHKQHFELVCTFLHPYTLNKGLRLNGKFISVPQKLVQNAGDSDITSHHQTSINTVVGDMQNVRPPEINPQLLKGLSPLVSINSDKSSMGENSVASSYTSQNDIEESIARGAPQKKQRKKSKNKKMREALICEPEDISIEIKPPTANIIEDVPSHIKAKQVYETRRKEHGESWLIPDDSYRKLVTSPPKVPSNTPIMNNIVDNFPKDLPERLQTCLESHAIETASASPLENEMTEVLDIDKGKTSDTESARRRHISKESDDIEILVSNLQGDAVKLMSSEDLSDCEFYDSALKYLANDIPDDTLETESDEESEDCIFFIEKLYNLKKEMLSVHIGAKYAKEKDAITGNVLEKLDLSSLSSVSTITQEKGDSNCFEIRLDFDTVKTSRQQRFYIFQDLESAQRMSKILQPFADAYALKEATVGALECLNCKSQFSKQLAHKTVLTTNKPFIGQEVMSSSYDTSKSYPHETDACPNCGNHILVEMESIPLPSIATPPRPIENRITVARNSSENTPENMSVGSSSSGNLFANLFTSIKISPMLKRKSIAVPFNDSLGEDSLKSVDTVSANDSGQEIPNRRASESQIRRNSSDLTIISNPSQSSIAVIPEPGMDSNLNTILEKDSQASLSPPISGRSTVLSNNVQFGNPGFENSGNYDEYADCLPPTTNDPDFYSLTESEEEKVEKPFKYSDIVSSDSDVYHSPFKSVGSANVNSSENIEADDTNKLLQILGDKKIMSCDSFLQLDHRLKLHVEINIFGNDEHLNACLQTAMVPLSTGEEFDGVFVLSSKNVYIIKFLPLYSQTLEQSESLDRQVQVVYSGPLNQVKQIQTLLGNQGISIACGPASQVYTLIIRDADICNFFCNLILEQILEKNPQLECLRNAVHTIHLLVETVLTEEKPEILLHQFAFQRDGDIVRPVCIILTEDNIFLSRILYKKQQSCTDLAELHTHYYADTGRHEVSDVISLKLKTNLLCVEVSFLIESSEIDSVPWTIEMQTKSAMFSFVSALKAPWEKIFGVPLPLNLAKADS